MLSRPATRESPIPSRHNSQRAASAQPSHDSRLFHVSAPTTGTPYNAQGLPQTPRGQTPPYTPRTPRESLPSTPLAQSPIRTEGTYDFLEESITAASTSSLDVSLTRDRGRTFTRADAGGPIDTGSQTLSAAYEREHDHPPDRYPESVALDPEGGIDEEDHPISVIPEDPDPVEQGHLLPTVNVRSNPTTGPPSAASSVNNMDLAHLQSSSSSFEQRTDPTSPLDATRSLPTLPNVDMFRIPSHNHSNHSQRPSLVPLSRQTSSQRSSTSPAPTTRPLPPSSSSLDRQSSPTSSNSVHINRARTASGAPGDQSPSRGRHNRFSFSAVSHILREVSQDMRDAVGMGSHHGGGSERGRERRSRSRAETPRNLSRVGSRADDVTVPPTPLSPTSTLGQGASGPWTPAGDGFVRAYGRGGAGSLDRDHTRSRTRGEGRHPADRSRERYAGDQEEEDGRRGRDATVNPLGDAAPATPTESKAKHASWKEFSRGEHVLKSHSLTHSMVSQITDAVGDLLQEHTHTLSRLRYHRTSHRV